jgi:hypothetical protein
VAPVLVTIAVVLLALWAVAMLGPFTAGAWKHFLLLTGLMLLMMSALRAREHALEEARRAKNGQRSLDEAR